MHDFKWSAADYLDKNKIRASGTVVITVAGEPFLYYQAFYRNNPIAAGYLRQGDSLEGLSFPGSNVSKMAEATGPIPLEELSGDYLGFDNYLSSFDEEPRVQFCVTREPIPFSGTGYILYDSSFAKRNDVVCKIATLPSLKSEGYSSGVTE